MWEILPLWWRARRGAGLVALVTLASFALGAVLAVTGNDILMLAAGIPAVVVARSLAPRDTPRERFAHRPPFILDAVLGLAMVILASSALTLGLLVGRAGQTYVLADNVWVYWSTALAFALMAVSGWLWQFANATAATMLTMVTLFGLRYVVKGESGAIMALVHSDTPAPVGWTVAVISWVVAPLFLTLPRRSRGVGS